MLGSFLFEQIFYIRVSIYRKKQKMKHFITSIELLLFVLIIVVVLFSKNAEADILSESFSLLSLITDIDQERTTENKRYNAYIADKHPSGAILTDGRDNYVFAYIEKNENAPLMNGERIIFKVKDAKKENGIFIVKTTDIYPLDNDISNFDVERIELENAYTTTLKKVEINEITINNGVATLNDCIFINVYDNFTKISYENGTHMHAVGYILRKNDVELNFYVTTKYERIDSLSINTKSLGIKGLAYGNGTATISGIKFTYKEIGDYGFGIQMRSKQNSTNNLSSLIQNTEEFKAPIKSIQITYNSSKTPRNENHVLCFSLGNTKECSDVTIYLNTNETKREYKIDIKKDFKYIKISVPDSYGYSNFVESFVLEFKEQS